MELTGRLQAIFYIVLGCLLILSGLGKTAGVDESVISATDEERERDKANPLGRIIAITAGSVAVIAGLYTLVR
jgi:hypothetical protein